MNTLTITFSDEEMASIQYACNYFNLEPDHVVRWAVKSWLESEMDNSTKFNPPSALDFS